MRREKWKMKIHQRRRESPTIWVLFLCPLRYSKNTKPSGQTWSARRSECSEYVDGFRDYRDSGRDVERDLWVDRKIPLWRATLFWIQQSEFQKNIRSALLMMKNLLKRPLSAGELSSPCWTLLKSGSPLEKMHSTIPKIVISTMGDGNIHLLLEIKLSLRSYHRFLQKEWRKFFPHHLHVIQIK